jgi:hypothetical protein
MWLSAVHLSLVPKPDNCFAVQCILLEGTDFGDHMELHHLHESGEWRQLLILQNLGVGRSAHLSATCTALSC